ncbi:hypothetical protein CVD19_02255 [Bacillus sp. T33-2]|nr:hypothetical protein CVD19_02255 [Bacillus sp. T33-2]
MMLTAVLALGCLFLVLPPLFRWDSHLNKKAEIGISANQKEVLLTTLNEIEFEYKMDKLSDKDYHKLKKQYEAQIARIMKEDERAEKTAIDRDLLAEVELEIEQAIAGFKKAKGGS